MKVRTKNLKPSLIPDARSESRASSIEHRVSSIGHRVSLCAFRFFYFSFLALCFLASLAGAKISSEQADPNSHLQRQLWRAAISIAKVEQDNRSKNELKRVIERIRSIEFKPREQPREPVVVVEPSPTTEPNKTAPDAAVPEEPEKKEAKPKLPYGPISEQTLQMLRSLSQHPEKLDNPFELAEILFLNGSLKEATVFYREALNRKSPNDAGSAQDRAWILFQIGNCLRNDDLSTALNMYRQLITEYPDSPWVDLAKTQCQLIAWYQKDEPRKLIAECK
jgi:tetratricopeptide (TPR) repeat protein